MMISLADVAPFKKEIQEKFGQNIHFHDRCGGQFFTIDEPSEELQQYIESYFTAKGMNVQFSDGRDKFLLV